MTGIIHKSRTAVRSPGKIPSFVVESVDRFVRLLRNRNYVAAVLFLFEGFTDLDLTGSGYTRYLDWKHDGNFVVREIHGSEMVLDIRDEGINRDLLLYGTREKLSSERFINELREFATDVRRDITVLDVGANIGYFAFLEANVLDDRAEIYAFEPHPDNLKQLEMGIELNDYDTVHVEPYALGSEEGTVDLQVADVSNKHRMGGLPGLSADVDSITVDTSTVDGFLAEQAIDADDPVVIRIDVEGGEHAVFRGAEELLASDRPVLAFVELHRGLTEEMAEDILSALSEAGFSVRYVSDGWGTELIDVNRFEELGPIESNMHIMARRG